MYHLYSILNTKTNRTYIGYTSNFLSRKYAHLQALKTNCHVNTNLQEDFNIGYKFEWEVKARTRSKKKIITLEKQAIQVGLPNLYNISGVYIPERKRKEAFRIPTLSECLIQAKLINLKRTTKLFTIEDELGCPTGTLSRIINKGKVPPIWKTRIEEKLKSLNGKK